MRLPGVHRPHHDTVEAVLEVLAVGQPLGIRGPLGPEQRADQVALVGGGDVSAVDLQHLEPALVVHEGDAGPVRGPRQRLGQRRFPQGKRGRLRQAVLGGDLQDPARAVVRRPGDPVPLGRPDGVAVVGPGGAGEVPGVPLVRGHGEDLAPGLEEGPLARGRERRGADVRAHVDPPGLGPGEVAPHGDVQALQVAGGGIQEVDPAVLLHRQDPVAPGERLRVGVDEVGELFQLSRGHVVGPHVHGVVPVRQEVDRVPHPHGLDVRGPLVREPDLLVRVDVQEDEGGVLSPPVVPPLRVPPGHGIHRDPGPVRGEAAVEAPVAGEHLGGAPVGRDRPETVHGVGRHLPPGGVEDPGAVGGPAPDQGRRRIPGQPLRLAAGHRHHVHGGHPRPVGAEGQPAAVGAQVGIALHRRGARDAPRLSPDPIRDPDVAAVGEGDVLGAHRGLPEHAGPLGIGRRRRADQEEERGEAGADEARGEGAHGSPCAE